MEKLYCIVDGRDRVVDDLVGLTLSEAEQALCRQLNLGVNAYLQEDDGSPACVKKFRLKKLTREEVYNLIGIGFCQPKFYKPHVWKQAKQLMDGLVCTLGFAFPYDFGRGKGKYESKHEIAEVKEQIANLICID
jgi:hypothetical protein